MKFLKTGLSLAVIGATLSVLPGSPSVAVGSPQSADDTSATARMRSAADGSVRISTESATGKVGFISARGASADLLPSREATSGPSAAAKAKAYLDAYGDAFGAAKGQLTQTDVQANPYGWTVTFDQNYRGVPVYAGRLKANLDKSGDLTAVGGYAAPDLSLSVEPRLSAAEAGDRAVAFVKADPPTSEDGGRADTSKVTAASKQLSVYRLGAVRGDQGKAVLVYVVEVTDKSNVRDMVFVDANTGKPVNRFSTITEALDRELQEATGTASAPVLTTVWREGDPLPGTLNDDQQNLVNSSGESYWLYQNVFGYDSYDGQGAKRITVNNDPRISCPNANWNGTTTNYCNGVTSDDVVAHEWGHAYTEYTSGLIYQYQSGALNEGYSDIWGETVDLINGREDEGEGDITAKRPDGLCSKYTRGNVGAVINSPASVAGPCAAAAAAAFGPVFDKNGVTTDVVVGVDPANTAGNSTTDGCSTFTNAADLAGKFVYVDRGTCPFAAKTQNAVAAGANGIVVGDNVPGRAPISMSGTANIYGVMVTQADGTNIKSAGTVNMTIKDIDTDEKADSYRWLIGEKSTAFGGAIRDMWNPTCYGNPGKVSDAEYNCDPLLTDNGGVHGNSGVINHAYALMVDGGDYNGESITGLGLDKSAAIWWRAQTAYLTPSSDFTSASDAIEQSCADLVGQPIKKLTVTPDATPVAADPITAADCTTATKVTVATEMRKDPVQCNFQPLLNPGELSPCGSGTVTETTVLDDFENGINAWTLEQELAPGATEGFPWESTDEAPAGRDGTVAYAPDPSEGSCAPGQDDISSRDTMISPDITVPVGQSPRVTFDHYVATEGGFDGGNVKVSVNDGAFAAVPASAFLFNPYNATMATAAGGNTSPLAGQPGFTGTDGGKTVGSWGQSTISVAKLGAKAGDTLNIRFDFGRDGCGGNDGWYLDNLVLSVCKKTAAVTAVHQPEPSTFGTASTIKVTAATAATGTVTLKSGSTEVASADLTDGAATIPVPADTPAGTYAWTVSYSGDDTFGPSSVPVTATVRKASTTTSVTAFNARVRVGSTAVVKAQVESPAGTPTGTVTLRSGAKTYGSATLSAGKVRIVTPAFTKAGTYRLYASYGGSANLGGSNTRLFSITVVK